MNSTRSLRAIALVALPALTFIRCGGQQKVAEEPTTMPSATMPSTEPPSDQTLAPDAGTAQTPAGLDIATGTVEAAPPAPKPEALSDAQIAAVTEAAHAAELAQAKIAQQKSNDATVKRFAALAITQLGQAKQKQAALKLKTEESGVSTAINADAGATLDALNTAPRTEFDKTYVAAQVTGQQKVLDTINDKLLPNVTNERLKAYLLEVKATAEQRLMQAKQLRATLDSKISSSAPGT